MKKGESLSASAKTVGVTLDEARSVLKSAKVIQKRKGRWILRDIPASMPIYTGGKATTIIPADRKSRSVVGKYLNAVKQFLATNRSEALQPFRRKMVRDISGERYAFDTDENALYRLASSGSEAFEEIYKYLV